MVLSRPCHPDDQFTTSILRHWCMRHDELLAEHIKSLLIKNNSLPRKRQRWDPRPPTHPSPHLACGRHLVVCHSWQAGPLALALFPEPCGWSLPWLSSQ